MFECADSKFEIKAGNKRKVSVSNVEKRNYSKNMRVILNHITLNIIHQKTSHMKCGEKKL